MRVKSHGRTVRRILQADRIEELAEPVALLPGYELAHVMTVHKSQRSESEQVLVVLPDDE